MTYKLSAETSNLLNQVSSSLESEVNDLRNSLDEESESFHESDEGEAVGAWLEDLENLLDMLNEATDKPV